MMPAIPSDSNPPQVKFLTVIWGEKYIERFCALSLPSFLAPGNLPSLAKVTRLEVVIMTRGSDIPHFEQNLSYKRLKTICPVRFVEIDDLITTAVYGVTLTLAYARPIIACGAEMLNTHFVFMNADFVLADGSLQSLARHIHAGRSIVLGPSYRAIAEELEPSLETMVDTSEGILSVPPRKLVGMALSHPHRTTIAKSFNQRAFTSSHPNQLFWQVDEHTVLARYFLIFMLCLKPEQVIDSVNCFCDYAFIPELCPSGDEVAMDDSDDFFMLEMQNRTQETSMLKQGQMSSRKIAGSLQEWTTTAHRRVASYDIIFHAQDIPPSINEYKVKANQAVAEIRSYLGRPKSHRNHFYWVMGVAAWKEYRQKQGLSYSAPELAPNRLNLPSLFYLKKHQLAIQAKTVARYLGRQLAKPRAFVLNGALPDSPWSPYWQTTRLRRQFSDSIRSSASQGSLLVIGHPSEIRQLGILPARAERWGNLPIADLLCEESVQYDQIVYFLAKDDHDYSGRLRKLLTYLKSNGTLHLFSVGTGKASAFPQFAELVYEIGEQVGNHLDALFVYSSGSRLLDLSNRLMGLARRRLLRYRRRWQLLAAVFLAPVTFLSVAIAYLTNVLASTGSNDKLVRHCFGVWIQVKTLGTLNKGLPAKEIKQSSLVAVE